MGSFGFTGFYFGSLGVNPEVHLGSLGLALGFTWVDTGLHGFTWVHLGLLRFSAVQCCAMQCSVMECSAVASVVLYAYIMEFKISDFVFLFVLLSAHLDRLSVQQPAE